MEKLSKGSGCWKIGRLTPDAILLTDNIDSPFTWASLAKSTIWGLIQSRMYSGDWNSEVEQNFELTYVGAS